MTSRSTLKFGQPIKKPEAQEPASTNDPKPAETPTTKPAPPQPREQQKPPSPKR